MSHPQPAGVQPKPPTSAFRILLIGLIGVCILGNVMIRRNWITTTEITTISPTGKGGERIAIHPQTNQYSISGSTGGIPEGEEEMEEEEEREGEEEGGKGGGDMDGNTTTSTHYQHDKDKARKRARRFKPLGIPKKAFIPPAQLENSENAVIPP